MSKLAGRPAPIALLAEGPTRPELLVSLPALARRIGPVVAGSFQQASRVANALRHGTPARSLEALRDAAIVICAGGTAREMSKSLAGIDRKWRAALVIFAGPPENDPAPELARRGARIATATLLPRALRQPYCLACGSPDAAKLLRDCGAKVVTAPMGSAPAFLTGMALIEIGLPQLLQAAAERLETAGLATADARAVLEMQAQSAIRGFLRTRRKPAVGAEIQTLASRIRARAAVP